MKGSAHGKAIGFVIGSLTRLADRYKQQRSAIATANW